MAERDVYDGDELVPVNVDPRFVLREKKAKHVRDLSDKMVLSGWTDDPMDGKAFHTPDGREVLNPLTLAPPIGYKEEPSLMELVQRALTAHLAGLEGNDEIDSIEDADDFEMQEEWDPTSLYEIREMIPEAPALPRAETSEKVSSVASPGTQPKTETPAPGDQPG